MLIDLQAAADGGLKLSFEDVLKGMDKARAPHNQHVVREECLVEEIVAACRARMKPGYSAKRFRETRTAESPAA